jgi:uncharacterized membrane protein
MALLQGVLLLGGFLLLVFGIAKMQKNKEPIVYVIAGILFIILGAIVSDPAGQDLEIMGIGNAQIALIASLIAIGTLLTKATIWVITRTELYKQWIGALNSVSSLSTIGKTVEDIKKDYEVVHSSEIRKKSGH